MKSVSCRIHVKGLRFVSRKTNLYRTLLIGIILTVSVLFYLSLQQSLQLENIDREWQQNHRGFMFKLTAQQEGLPHRTYLISRTRCTQKVFLLIMVLTHPANFKRRTIIRKTWATDPSLQIRWKTVFLLGRVAGNSTQNEYLEAESMMYKDIIRGAQNESYYNLTLKIQMGLEWAAKYCDFQFLLKTDDDVFINPFNLIDYLRNPDTPQTKLYMGRCTHNQLVLRGGKYGVSVNEYGKDTYPDFCNGPSYVLSSDLVSKLVELFDTVKPFKLEDVYIGMLVQKLGGVQGVRHAGFRRQPFGPCKYFSDALAIHRRLIPRQCLENLFNEARKERVQSELNELRSMKTLP